MGGDLTMIAHLQRIAGMCLSGDIREQCLFIFYGTGANGKSVFLDTLAGLLGDYAGEAAPDLLVIRRSEEHPCEVADLCGKRLVVASETEEGIRLKVQLIKRLTGNARIKARFMRQDYFEFSRTHKLILATNNRPVVREGTHAIKRRLWLIPFNVTIPESEQDKELIRKLTAEWPGILAWAVRGCLAWECDGLTPPPAVSAATQSYLDEQDLLRDFLESCCVLAADAWTDRTELFAAYEKWAMSVREHSPLDRTRFYERVRRPGIEDEGRRVQSRMKRGFHGIGLLTDEVKQP
jgi:putative DNA primase/helicase